jgi:hypothetical protein
MRRFIETTYFRCLSNGFTEKDIELNEAYDEFVHHLVSFCKNEQDLILLSLTLSYTKSELQSLKQQHVASHGNACCFLFIDKGLCMIDSAINVVDLRINNPKILGQPQAKPLQKSPLRLSDSVGYVDIMEIVCGLFYAGILQSISGSIVNFADVTRVFEVGFNFDFADIYKKRDEVIKRKPSKRTEFLNRLIYAINTESKNRGYL